MRPPAAGTAWQAMAMQLRDDPSTVELVAFDATEWIASPQPAVTRKLLERDGGEVARATSIVRYAPGSSFPAHGHERGEEFVVLEGTFSDEHGSYPEGSYVRNPPGSRHRPFSEGGCTIFVKLRQSQPDDLRRVVAACDLSPVADGAAKQTALHAHGNEGVSLVRLGAGARLALGPGDVAVELLVLRGDMTIDGEACARWGWFRAPRHGQRVETTAGCAFWMKRGHLPGPAGYAYTGTR